MSTDRAMLKMMVSPTVKEGFDAFCERNGMSQTAVATRLFNWFNQQSEEFQKTIIGVIPLSLSSQAFGLLMVQMVRAGLVGTTASKDELDALERDVIKVVDGVTRQQISEEVRRLRLETEKPAPAKSPTGGSKKT